MNDFRYSSWICPETGYSCVSAKNFWGGWSGYVGVDPQHSLYQVQKNSEEFKFIEIDQAIVYSGWLMGFDVLFSPPIHRWWFGVEYYLQYSRAEVTLFAAQLQYFDERFFENVESYLDES
jgi:hypothetical protein